MVLKRAKRAAFSCSIHKISRILCPLSFNTRKMAEIKTRVEIEAVRVDWARVQYCTKDNPKWIDLENACKTRFPTNICDVTFEA